MEQAHIELSRQGDEARILVKGPFNFGARHGFVHWQVPKSAIKLLTWKTTLSSYVWRHVLEGHQFCPVCGVGLIRAGYPNDHVNVNARCIEGIDVFELNIVRYDGRHDMPPGPEEPCGES